MCLSGFQDLKSTDLDSVITGDKWASRTSRKTILLDSFVETNTMRDSKWYAFDQAYSEFNKYIFSEKNRLILQNKVFI